MKQELLLVLKQTGVIPVLEIDVLAGAVTPAKTLPANQEVP